MTNPFDRVNVPLFVVAILGIGFGLGCALTGPHSSGQIAFLPAGPGTVFDTVEDAAIDGLAHAYLLSKADGNSGLMYGGTIRPEKAGFTYDPLVSATPENPTALRTTLRRADVARFHVYPRTAVSQVNRRNERVSRFDRVTVDRRDPVHRPLFVLTPRLSVMVYRGKALPSTSIASLRPVMSDEQLAGR